ncbi:hypothetical protein [Paenibacillus spongiae]|uniref:Uncharacterized protein n=1 Tax=Paenibacillus spongiae TaxID=2909671 RepID=A0ABY5SK60_9BACL|nr:hypothetical protein [Paenibacillus spongiae]UVI32988.1 hypothetical protein L1F29_14630 [Paenibacillus spongiae]
MEEKISLALAVKLKKIYDREDQFLSFPMGLTYSYRSLDFMKEQSDLSALERLHYMADFARMINYIPSDREPHFSPSGSFLWNEMKDILINAEFANSTLSPEEVKQLAEAIDFLTDEQIKPDGTKTTVPSDKVKVYTTYKIAYEEANEAYLAEKLTVENATGDEGKRLKNFWESGREQQLRNIKDQAMQNWINLGLKNEVESNQMMRNILEVKKYPVLYRQDYLNDIDLSEVPDAEARGIPFCATFFNPRDAFDLNQPWIQVPLIKDEIDSLIQQAPIELKGIFSSDQSNEDIESMSLEYKYVGVKRSWFRPEFFQSRLWKMPDESVISDGGIPRQGRIPAYITGLLVVRNITVTKKKASAAKANILPILNIVPVQKLNLTREPVHFFRIENHRPWAVETMMQPVRIRDFKPAMEAMTVSNPILGLPLLAVFPINPPDTAPETVIETFNFNGVVVVAFVCQRVPKSPDPDPNMW